MSSCLNGSPADLESGFLGINGECLGLAVLTSFDDLQDGRSYEGQYVSDQKDGEAAHASARAHRGTGEMLMKEAFDLCRASSDGLTATCLHLTAFEVASIQKERLIDGALALARLGAW